MIHPYRMEGKVELDGKTMFLHWKPLLTDLLIDSVKADDGILVHLATEEMQHLFNWKRVCKEVKVIQPEFLVMKNGYDYYAYFCIALESHQAGRCHTHTIHIPYTCHTHAIHIPYP